MPPERSPRRRATPGADALEEGVDYYVEPGGRYVFTEHYNRRRGYCCFQGCRHCPWGQAGKGPEAAREALAERLAALQRRVNRQRPRVMLHGYRNGILFAKLADLGGPGDRERVEPRLRRTARGLLTVLDVEWV